ncbi:TRAP transporter small permease [Marimonas arenosa]|uniref:TRAP transporter small permease protein n=1 Tax=Marimonas arenosa TaxID=1795305 RepID=A0AAE3WF35_9RHOB|nr:TRAP transporter small permease subunit [Marimonas arenosa]MDQ2091215.1 TRAP transporter small permease subunit [Marimonas arenosa]
MMRAAALTLDRISAALNAVAIWGAIIAVLVMIGAAGWQVVARYLLDQPPVWTEELARFSMVWAGVLGGSCAFRAMADPSLFPAMRDTTGRPGAALAILRALGAFAFIAPILWYSAFGLNGKLASGYVGRLMGRQAETMDLPMAVFGIAIPIAFALVLIHLLADLGMRLTGQPRSAT